jgi:flagellar hook-associated protein FlgK
MKPNFSKKQVLVSENGTIVLSDGQGTHTVTGTDYTAFAGILVYDPTGQIEVGYYSKYWVADRFNPLPADFFVQK